MLASNEIMRRNNNKGNVRTITTGHIEGDMLGQVFLWLSERQNSRYAQRPHRTYKRRPSPESKVRVFFRAAIEWSQTAPTACLRSIRDRISKMRKQKRNGN